MQSPAPITLPRARRSGDRHYTSYDGKRITSRTDRESFDLGTHSNRPTTHRELVDRLPALDRVDNDVHTCQTAV